MVCVFALRAKTHTTDTPNHGKSQRARTVIFDGIIQFMEKQSSMNAVNPSRQGDSTAPAAALLRQGIRSLLTILLTTAGPPNCFHD